MDVKALAAVDQPTIGYVAFSSDIEHNLDFDSGPVSENDAVSEHLIPPQVPNHGISLQSAT